MFRWNKLIGLLLVGFTVFSLQGCGGDSTGSPSLTPPASTTGSPSAALSLFVPTDDGTNVNVLPGEKISRNITLLKPGTAHAQLLLATPVAGVQIVQDAQGAVLAIDGATLTPGTQLPVTVVAKNLDDGTSTQASLIVNVLAPQVVASGQLTPAGGAVVSPDGSIGVQVDPGQLSAPLGVTIRTAITPSGATKIRIKFDRDVSGETGIITLISNQLSPDSPPTLLAQSVKQAAPGQLLATPPVRLLALSSPPYPISIPIQNYTAYFADLVGPDNHRIASASNVTDKISRTCVGPAVDGICLEFDPQAAQLQSSMTQDALLALKKSGKEIVPVLFIHGFTGFIVAYQVGGGEKTWNDFPQLVKTLRTDTTEFVPFEFRWRTDTAFSVVADDLASAIVRIHNLTGRPVRIIAHSLGGLLVRTLLQGLAENSKPFAGEHVRSVMTLGAPHSGVFASKRAGPSGITFPDGRDTGLIGFCRQISCFQAGEVNELGLQPDVVSLTNAGVQGGIIASLAKTTANPLPPNLPFVVGIGLTVGFSIYDDGDGLISFNGQRFSTTLAEEPIGALLEIKPFLNCDQSFGGKVKEVVLGAFDSAGNPDLSARPGSAVLNQALGYAHVDNLLFAIFRLIPIKNQEPFIECTALGNCEHAAINLFKSTLNNERYCENPALFPPEPAPSPTASITSVTVSPLVPNVGALATFSLNGTDLQPGFAFVFPGCAPDEISSASTTQRQFTCTLTQAGANLQGIVSSADGTTLISFNQSVSAAADGPTQAQRLSISGDSSCALTAAGGVKCWGENSNAQIGDGSTQFRRTPTDVVGLGSGVVAVSAGGTHTCALMAAGSVMCWGVNGLLRGDGTTQFRLTPADVVGLGSGVVAVSAGGSHTCVLTSAGGVKCWGSNTQGQLGDGTTQNRPTPVDVVGLSSGVLAVSVAAHSCALTVAGGVKCWGNNTQGQLGDGTTQNRTTPVDVAGLSSGVLAVSVGAGHSCALTVAGGVKCWGGNAIGQLGDGTTQNRLIPVDVAGLSSGVAAVSAGSGAVAGGPHTCAVTNAGGVKCWGGLNQFGELGDGTRQLRLIPVDVVGLSSGVAAVSAGGGHSCAIMNAGGAKCWGHNDNGQLGNAIPGDRLTPVDVVGL